MTGEDRRTIVVTGGAGGMGEAIIELLEAEGASVVSWDRGIEVEGDTQMKVDVSDAGSVEDAWQRVVAVHGRVHGLVNGAGIWIAAPIEDTTLELWNREIGVNLTGTFLTCKLAVAHMREHGGGAIVNIASLAALRPPKLWSSAYAASKAGVLMFTRALASEVGAYGIRVNAISPGPIDTEMLRGMTDPASREMYQKQPALSRFGTAHEIATVTAFLLGEGASFVSGANIEVAGG